MSPLLVTTVSSLVCVAVTFVVCVVLFRRPRKQTEYQVYNETLRFVLPSHDPTPMTRTETLLLFNLIFPGSVDKAQENLMRNQPPGSETSKETYMKLLGTTELDVRRRMMSPYRGVTDA